MNIYTVRDNLRNTIAGKEKYLAELRKKHSQLGVSAAVASYVEINIAELKKILADVETCCEQALEQSWAGQVDRQGGAFDESELRGRDGWL